MCTRLCSYELIFDIEQATSQRLGIQANDARKKKLRKVDRHSVLQNRVHAR